MMLELPNNYPLPREHFPHDTSCHQQRQVNIGEKLWFSVYVVWMHDCYFSSLRQGSALKPAVAGTWVAIAAMALCLEKFETRLRPEPREVQSTVTPASRSPTCEVIGGQQTTEISFITLKSMSWTLLFSIYTWTWDGHFFNVEPLEGRLHFLKGVGFFFTSFLV